MAITDGIKSKIQGVRDAVDVSAKVKRKYRQVKHEAVEHIRDQFDNHKGNEWKIAGAGAFAGVFAAIGLATGLLPPGIIVQPFVTASVIVTVLAFSVLNKPLSIKENWSEVLGWGVALAAVIAIEPIPDVFISGLLGAGLAYNISRKRHFARQDKKNQKLLEHSR